MEGLITLEDGPVRRQSVAESYTESNLPPELAALKDKRIYCPKTGRHYAQKNDNQIFLVPVDVRPAEPMNKKQDARTTDERMAVLLDKLGERLAFERQGTRLYEAFLLKVEAAPRGEGGPSAEDLRHIYLQENEHFKFLHNAITDLGGDPAVQTPSADLAGILSHGVLEIVTDPSTTIAQTLQAILNVELVDNDGWQMLMELAAELRQPKLEEQCRRALAEEQEHLNDVRGWLATMTRSAGSGGE
jgi:rubrerythrin